MTTRCEHCHKRAIGGVIHFQSIIGFIVLVFSVWLLFFSAHTSKQVVNVPQLNHDTGKYYNHYVEIITYDNIWISILAFIGVAGGGFTWTYGKHGY